MMTMAIKVRLDIYSECKYKAIEEGHNEVFENAKTVEYDGVVGWWVVNGKDADIENTDGTCIDDYDEYLILDFANGDTATFRNSYVDMFRLS